MTAFSTNPPRATPSDAPARLATGPIAVGAAVAGLTLVVFQWVLFVSGIPRRLFFLLAALFVAQSVFNGVVLGCVFGEMGESNPTGAANDRHRALRQVSVVLVAALFAMSGVLPLAFAWNSGGKISDTAVVLAIGGLMAAAVLALVVAPVLYALAVRRRSNR